MPGSRFANWTGAVTAYTARRTSLARRDVVAAAAWLRRLRAELLTAGALLCGWGSLTYGVAIVIPSRAVWPISVGLLLLSGCGWQFIGAIAKTGLYVLNRKAQRG